MERKYSIDLLRIISSLAVIIIHTVSAPVTYNAIQISTSVASHLELIHTLMNWSVPVFFMITGYCLLLKQNCTYRYCFLHATKYLGILFSIGLFYSLLEEIFNAKTINTSIILKSVQNVFTGNLWDHMWFIYALIGIYLVMPVLHSFIQQSRESAVILTSLLFFFNILCPTFEKYIHLGIIFPFSGYLFYVCYGSIIAKYKICTSHKYLCCFLGLLSILWIIMSSNSSSYGYDHLSICLIAMSIITIFNDLTISPSKLILKVSECTLGIYIIHPFFINVALKLLKLNMGSEMPYLKLLLFTTVIFFISFISTCVLQRIPVIKRLF